TIPTVNQVELLRKGKELNTKAPAKGTRRKIKASGRPAPREVITAAMMNSKIPSHDRASVDGGVSNGNGNGNSNGAEEYKARRTLENELDQAVQRYIELYDFAPIGYVSMDRVGRIEEVNLA